MNKLAAAYMIIFLLFSYFSSIFEGGGGIVATTLTESLEDTETVAVVANTTGFLVPVNGFSPPVLSIGNEDVTYTGLTGTTFTGLTRKYRGTSAPDSHAVGRAVYTVEVGVLNKAFGFDIVSTGEAYTEISAVTIGWNFFTTSLGYLASFNFALLTGDLVYVRYLLLAGAVGFIIYFAIIVVGTLFGIIRK